MATKWLTTEEAADYLRCSERTLRELMANNQIPHTLFAGKALFSPERLDAWLLSMEKGPMTSSQEPEEHIEKPATGEAVPVLAEYPREAAAAIIDEFKQHEDGFVSGLGKNLEEELQQSQHASMSSKVHAQLSRWCWPKRNTARERWVQPKAQELSRLLFGKVIDRVRHPSYAERIVVKNNNLKGETHEQ